MVFFLTIQAEKLLRDKLPRIVQLDEGKRMDLDAFRRAVGAIRNVGKKNEEEHMGEEVGRWGNQEMERWR